MSNGMSCEELVTKEELGTEKKLETKEKLKTEKEPWIKDLENLE